MANFSFVPSTTQYAPCGPSPVEADGKRYIWAIAHAALTAKTPYLIYVNEYGNVTAAASGIASYTYVAIPNDTIASGALCKLQIGGYCADVITPSLSLALGHAVGMTAGAVTDEGVDFTGLVNEWAACCTASTDATTQDLMLCGHLVLTKAS